MGNGKDETLGRGSEAGESICSDVAGAGTILNGIVVPEKLD